MADRRLRSQQSRRLPRRYVSKRNIHKEIGHSTVNDSSQNEPTTNRPHLDRCLSMPSGMGPPPPRKKGLLSTIVKNLRQEVEGENNGESDEHEYLDPEKVQDLVDNGSNSQRAILNTMPFAKDECFTVNEDGLITLDDSKDQGNGLFNLLQNTHHKKVDNHDGKVANSIEKVEKNNRNQPGSLNMLGSLWNDNVMAKLKRYQGVDEEKNAGKRLVNEQKGY